MIVQNVSAAATGRTDVTFTCPQADGQKALAALEQVKAEIGFEDLRYDDGIAKISLVGAGMRSHPGVSATFFAALSDAGINVEMISTSEIRISVVTRAETRGHRRAGRAHRLRPRRRRRGRRLRRHRPLTPAYPSSTSRPTRFAERESRRSSRR